MCIEERAFAVRRIVQECLESGFTYDRLAKESGASASSIKKFVARVPKSHRESETLRKLRAFIISDTLQFSTNVRYLILRYADLLVDIPLNTEKKLEEQNKNAYDLLVAQSYFLIYRVLNVHDIEIKRRCRRICGDFFGFRQSVEEKRIVKSNIVVKQRNSFEYIFEFIHIEKDHLNNVKHTDGIVVPISNNFYMIGDIEKGEGLEIIVLKDPALSEVRTIRGFTISMDYRRQPFFARTLLTRKSDETSVGSEPDFGSFDVDEVNKFIPEKEQRLIFSMIDNRNGRSSALSIDRILRSGE